MTDYRDLLKKYMKYMREHGDLGDMLDAEDLMVFSEASRSILDREDLDALLEIHFELINAEPQSS